MHLNALKEGSLSFQQQAYLYRNPYRGIEAKKLIELSKEFLQIKHPGFHTFMFGDSFHLGGEFGDDFSMLNRGGILENSCRSFLLTRSQSLEDHIRHE